MTVPKAVSDSVARARADVERTIAESVECQHRALSRKYNLLRVSDRRWAIVRVSSQASTLFGLADVITFERVTPPLAFDLALQTLANYRGDKTTVKGPNP